MTHEFQPLNNCCNHLRLATAHFHGNMFVEVESERLELVLIEPIIHQDKLICCPNENVQIESN